MTAKQIVALAGAFAAGVLLGVSPWRLGNPKTSVLTRGATAVIQDEPNSEMRAAYEEQIADLKGKLAAAQSPAKDAGSAAPVPRTPDESASLAAELSRATTAATQEIEAEKLLAAGFPLDRIQWIRERTVELLAQYEEEVADQRQKQGSVDPDFFASHFYDRDIGLRREMGDDEYVRYRQALGRSIGLKVGQVVTTGVGHAAGLYPGDEIVAYNGARVFNIGELNPLVRNFEASGGTATVDVLRNGQSIRLSIAAGNPGIQQADPFRPLNMAEMRPKIGQIVREARKKLAAEKARAIAH